MCAVHGENFMSIFTTLSVVIWFFTDTLGIFATLVYVFIMRVVIYDILSVAIITTLSTFILFCNLYYIHWKKILITITVLARYSCSIFIFLFILYRRIVKNMVLCMKFYTSLGKFIPNMVYHIFDYSTI